MLKRWRIARQNRAIVDLLYQELVSLTRQPKLYEAFGIADTFMGRFEALSVHVFLCLRRCRMDAELAPLAQDLVDRFMADIDNTVRELGVGDQSVPKRMRKLAGIFYDRVRRYEDAFDQASPTDQALAESFAGRAIERPEEAPEGAAAGLAAYMITMEDRFRSVPTERILTGNLIGEN
ncbi:ubiquinol-cytochrome C chaperone family protein [Jiella marina]|uniref:ubiquinol-cytochrome C chaperone family protein n=1 Tax=Jiella sp. LLJ827 TaxID=2917712 RepID=UPI002100F653|nr:ubiquinol-cytochrome C chaperone family protein [Jiella sp. LLJ827]MCQ0989207.1 hypothetical protein [Jiella sp. LLJ827]